MQEKTREIAEPKIPSNTETPWDKEPPRRNIKPYLIGSGLVLILAIFLFAFINAKSFAQDRMKALQQFQKDQKLGLPASQLAKQYSELKALQNQDFGPIPTRWLGASQQIISIRDQARHSYSQYSNNQAKLALAAGKNLSQVQTGWNIALTASKINLKLKAALSLKAREALKTKWETEASSWKKQIAQLSQASGGLTQSRPIDVVNIVATLNTHLNAAPSTWTGISQAQDAVVDTRTYLTLSLSKEISGHEEIVDELKTSLKGLKPPSSNPFGSSFISYLNTRQYTVSAEVYNYNTGSTYSFQPGISFDSASIVKATIMATLLWQSQQSGKALSTTEQQLMVPMIENSSNSAATALWNDAGGSSGVQSFLNAAGMVNTVPGKGGFWGLTQVNVNDEIKLLKILSSPNSILSSSSQAFESHLMQNVTYSQAWGVSGGVASGTTTSLKNGWLPIGNQGWVINSIGTISGNGHKYCVVLLSKGAPSQSYGIQTLNTISKLIWNKL